MINEMSLDKKRLGVSVDIAAPAERVWSVMSDVERWHEWTASIRRVQRLDEGPMRIGSRARVYQPGFPPALWTVTEFEPDGHFVWISRAPGLLVTARHSVEARVGGCRATLALEFAGLLGGFWAGLTNKVNLRYLHMEAAGLKQRSESPQPGT